jgi:murein DD-endopeptidase MepM/ murein hydrolase activator NlpD
MSYFSEIYSPSASNPNQFNNLYKNYFRYNGRSIPDSIDDMRDEGRRLADAYRQGLDRKHARNPVTEQQRREVLASGVDLRALVPANGRFTSPYGMRMHPVDHVRKFHTGIDIDGQTGDRVNAWKDGKVAFCRRRGGYGKLVVIEHDDGSESYYAHLNGFNVKKGQRVHAGDQIGQMGNTGKSTGSHLHFEIRIGGQPVNPLERFNN